MSKNATKKAIRKHRQLYEKAGQMIRDVCGPRNTPLPLFNGDPLGASESFGMAALGNRHREALLLLSKGNTIVKLFSNTSNVRRGAREAGLTNFAIVEVDGKFGFEAAHPMTASEFAAVSVPAPAPISSITANAMRALTGVDESKPEPRKAPKAKPVCQGARQGCPQGSGARARNQKGAAVRYDHQRRNDSRDRRCVWMAPPYNAR
jgi:hypothetical protein